jgi:autophagy-related protein 9
MMASNILSRLLPTNPSGRSIYDDLRAHDAGSESDLEEHAGLAVDEENLNFRDEELGNADVFNGEESLTTESTAFLTTQQNMPQGNKSKSRSGGSKWVAQSPRLLEEEGDDDVPESLLIEGNDMPGTTTNPARARQGKSQRKQPPVPGTSSRENRAHWEAAQAQQRLHQDEGIGGPQPVRQSAGPLGSNAREKAMWRWINVTNLDNFIKEVYEYYYGAGMWTIILSRALNLG